jgi:SAM-dependent methyltransferase
VADVGCGNGFDLRQIVPQGLCRAAIGLDLSAGMLRSARDWRATLERPSRVSLVQADAQRLPLPADSVDVALAMHMLYHVPDLELAVAELRRIVRPGGILLASTNSRTSMRGIHDLFDAAVSGLVGRPVRCMAPDRFTTETGTDFLAAQFADVVIRPQEVSLSFPEADPVITYVDSVRAPILSYVGIDFDFDAALAGLADRVNQVIEAEGRFRATSRSGVFVCR